MAYGLNLTNISLAEYRSLLARQNLLPGRRILLDDLERNFSALSAQGIETLEQLRQRISTPQKIDALSSASGITQEYLIILRRELGILEQSPVPLSVFPGVDERLVSALAERGIRTSKDFWERGGAESAELCSLCDLVRVSGVGALAARAFYEAGYRGAADVAAADAADMLRRVNGVNEEKRYYKARLGEKDMQFCIDFAVLLLRYCD